VSLVSISIQMKKPYTLEKIGLAVKKELEKW
jgi:hypothetical protein